jgi:hypothetical protein
VMTLPVVGEKRCSPSLGQRVPYQFVAMLRVFPRHWRKRVTPLSDINLLLSVSVRKDFSDSRFLALSAQRSAFVPFPRHWLVSTDGLPVMAMILTPPAAQTFHSPTRILFINHHTNMKYSYYMNLAVLVLAASIAPSALSAPIG